MMSTEARHDSAKGFDQLNPAAQLRLLADGQVEAAKTVAGALTEIGEAAQLAHAALKRGGRLIYIGAGSSGLMAMADALELPGTYGIQRDRIVILLAGGADSLVDLAGGYEDDTGLADADLQRTAITADDCVICVSASGGTPYVVHAAQSANALGATVISMANVAGAKLFEPATVGIVLATPPEVISGSTRMGAGTAQKIAFNMFSTLLGVELGHVMDGHMVNLKADNEKLRGRAVRMVRDIAGVGPEEAEGLLHRANGAVKIALLLAAGARDSADAQLRLDGHDNNLRAALDALSMKQTTGT